MPSPGPPGQLPGQAPPSPHSTCQASSGDVPRARLLEPQGAWSRSGVEESRTQHCRAQCLGAAIVVRKGAPGHIQQGQNPSPVGMRGSSWASGGGWAGTGRAMTPLGLWWAGAAPDPVFSFSLHQGLSTATKDTYDALHMQALPPR